MERVVGLEDLSDVSACTQHQLVGASRVTGYELTDIVYLCKSMGCHLQQFFQTYNKISQPYSSVKTTESI